MADDAGLTTGSAGGGEMIQALGKTWTLAPVTFAIQAKFERWCRLRARQALVEDKDGLPADAYQENLSSLNREIAAGRYSWGVSMGEVIRDSLNDLPGLLHLLGLLLQVNHDSITQDDVRAIFEGNPEGVGLALKATLGNRRTPAMKPGTER